MFLPQIIEILTKLVEQDPEQPDKARLLLGRFQKVLTRDRSKANVAARCLAAPNLLKEYVRDGCDLLGPEEQERKQLD